MDPITISEPFFAIEAKKPGKDRGKISRSPSRRSTNAPFEARNPSFNAFPLPAFFSMKTGTQRDAEALAFQNYFVAFLGKAAMGADP